MVLAQRQMDPGSARNHHFVADDPRGKFGQASPVTAALGRSQRGPSGPSRAPELVINLSGQACSGQLGSEPGRPRRIAYRRPMDKGMVSISSPRRATTVHGPNWINWSKRLLIHTSRSGSAASPWCADTDHNIGHTISNPGGGRRYRWDLIFNGIFSFLDGKSGKGSREQ